MFNKIIDKLESVDIVFVCILIFIGFVLTVGIFIPRFFDEKEMKEYNQEIKIKIIQQTNKIGKENVELLIKELFNEEIEIYSYEARKIKKGED